MVHPCLLLRGFSAFPAVGDAAEQGGAGDDSSEGDDGTDYVTACGSQPEFLPVESAAANGGITVTFEVHAVCPGGGWLNTSGQRVTLIGLGDVVFADASFDFSDSPYWIPGLDDDPATMRLTCAYDTVFSTLEELGGAIDSNVVVVECETEPGSSEGTVPADPSFGADATHPVQAAPGCRLRRGRARGTATDRKG